MTLDEIRTQIADLRHKRAEAREKLGLAAIELSKTTDRAEADTLENQIDGFRNEINLTRNREIRDVALELDPKVHVQTLDGAIPILLAPLRIHTRFDRDASALLIRVYPDDFSIENHEPRLSASERAAGSSFWAAPEVSPNETTPSRRDLWRGIASRFGLRRAAWIIRATNPDDPAPGPDIDQPVRIPAAWTLPERLVFLPYGDGDRLLADNLIGSPIPDGLEMSFDVTKPNLGFARNNSDLDYPAELQWQVDFNEAIKVGMGISVPINLIGNPRIIRRLVVLGVRLSTDEQQSASLLENLIASHRYTSGFSIVPQGTPSNVTHDSDMPPPQDVDAALDWLKDGGFAAGGQGILYDDEPDGLRLAHALGIEPDVMRFVEKSNCTDAKEAIAMKRALWAGTFGYYIQQVLQPQLRDNFEPQFPPDSPERLILAARFYFTNFVFGRGPLPAFRVGSQPYGVLPVCADMLKRSDPRQVVWSDRFVDAFLVRLHDKMITLSHTWLEEVANVAQAGPGPNANARLLDVLATQASSVEWHMERLIGRQYLREYANFKGKQTAMDDFAFKLGQRFALFQAEYPGLLNDWAHIFDLTIFGGYWNTVVNELDVEIKNLERGKTIKLDGDVIDNLPFSEVRQIDEKYPNYVDWMARSRFDRVKQGLARMGPNNQPDPVRSLFYIALRYSYLYEHAFTAMRFHARFQNKSWNQFLEKELYNLAYEYDTLPWDLVSEVKQNWQLGGIAPTGGSVLNFIETRDDLKVLMGLNWRTMFGDIDEMLASLKSLAALPTARLERLFAEHMDLASYRLDAWLTGYAFERLVAYRVWRLELQPNRLNPLYEQQSDRPPIRFALNHRPLGRYSRGIYLGAYGWVENLQPDPIPEVVNDLPAELTPRNGRQVTRDADNYGLIHAPSVNQAITAAILRSASVTQPDVPAFNVDLSSTRVRDALWIMEGVRNGQMPAALLGYRFERRLRELDVKLLGYLPDLRVAFPMPRQPDTDPGPNESIIARDVVNGLLVLQAKRDGTLDAKLTSASVAGPHRTVMSGIADELIDSFDACGDLMIAESAHHAAQGNYERAGGAVTAAGEFTHVPAEFDVVETPRTGTALSHRILLAFEAGPALAPGSGTPRSRLESGLNQWIGSLVGDPSKLVCSVSYVFPGAQEDERQSFSIALNQLGLEPIDLLYAVDDRASDELGRRLDLKLRPQFDAAHPNVELKSIEVELFAKGPPGTRPAGEVIQLLHQLRSLLSASSPATRRDFLPAKELHDRTQDEVDGIDENELMQRVLGVRRDNPGIDQSSLWSSFAATKGLFDPIDGMAPANEADRAAFATQIEIALLAASRFGIAEAVPRPAPAATRFDSLKVQAAAVKAVLNSRFVAASSKWKPVTPPEKNFLQTCREVTEALLGGGFPLMAKGVVPLELNKASLPAAAPNEDTTSDWLFLASTVREDAGKLQRMRVLSEELGKPFGALQVFQWPETQKAWIAGPPPAGKKFEGDLTSIVVQTTGGFDATNAVGGLIIDEWQEVIPGTHETTGVSFHYDAPNAEPPQTLLLAVSQRNPNNNLRWMWNELLECVNQSLALAKMRAVGPDQLRSTRLDTVLPATLAAEAAVPATIAASFLANVDIKVAKQDFDMWTHI